MQATVTGAEPQTLLEATPVSTFEETLDDVDNTPKSIGEKSSVQLVDKKGASSARANDEEEPPPPYNEGSSPLESFAYVMAAAGGAASIITQVQQTAGPPINSLGAGEVGPDEHITLDLRGTRFTLSRDELLTLPEFVLLSLFPNGLLPDGHMNSFHDGDVYPVDVSIILPFSGLSQVDFGTRLADN